MLNNGVLDPNNLSLMLEKIQRNHYRLMAQIGNMLQTEIEFEGGEDPEASELEKWRQTYRTRNQDIQTILKKN